MADQNTQNKSSSTSDEMKAEFEAMKNKQAEILAELASLKGSKAKAEAEAKAAKEKLDAIQGGTWLQKMKANWGYLASGAAIGAAAGAGGMYYANSKGEATSSTGGEM